MVTVCIPAFESISCPIVLSFYYSFYLADRCAIWYILNPGKFFSVGACMSRDFDIFMSKHLAGQLLLNSYIYSFKFSSLFSTFTDFDEQQIRPLRHSRFPLLPACLNGRICFHISVLFFSCFFHFFSVIIPSGNQDQSNQLQNRRCQCCHICKCCRCQNFLRTL